MTNKSGRNELCSCGSGKKYKKCCGFKAQAQKQLKASVLKQGLFPSFGKATRGLADRLFKVVKDRDQAALKPLKVTKGDPKTTPQEAPST